LKGETIEITYSYWDGTGHRKSVEVSPCPCPGYGSAGQYRAIATYPLGQGFDISPPIQRMFVACAYNHILGTVQKGR
jgi:hypothetical protein